MTGIIWAVAIAQCISPISHNVTTRETVAVSCQEGSLRVYRYEPAAPAVTPATPNKEVKTQKARSRHHTVTRKAGKRQTTQRKYRRKRAKLY